MSVPISSLKQQRKYEKSYDKFSQLSEAEIRSNKRDNDHFELRLYVCINICMIEKKYQVYNLATPVYR